jgi:site-specific recombinase XerD
MHDSTALISSPASGPGALALFVGRVLDGIQSPSTRRNYRRDIDAFVSFMSDRREPLSKGLLNEYKAQMKANGRGDHAINSALSAVRFFLRQAADDGLLPAVEVERATKVRNIQVRGTKAGNWLTKGQAETLLQIPDGETALAIRDRAILAVLVGAGLRRSEAAALTVEHIQQREGRWVIVDLRGKRNKLRSVPIPAWCKALVDAWTSAAGISSGLVFRQASWSKDKFEVGDQGLSDKGIARAVTRWTREMGLTGIAAHDLRRSFAKLAHVGGADLAQIQINLGHDSLETTQKYLGAQLDFQDAAADHLGLTVKL